MPKQISILGGAGAYHLAGTEHDSHVAHCRRDLARRRIDAVPIYAQRAANAEDIDGLHRLDRQAFFV